MSDFEKKVRKALIDMDMTLTGLADELQISVSYLYEIIRGTRKAEDKRQKIIDFLGVNHEQIISHEDC